MKLTKQPSVNTQLEGGAGCWPTGKLLKERREAALRVAGILGEDPEVTAVYVFGSVASGYVDEHSDVDITFVFRSQVMPPAVRQQLLSSVASRYQVGDPLQSQPIWEAFDTMVVDGISVESHYQLVPHINQVLEQVVNEGAITTQRIPFRPYTLAGMIQRAWVLIDKEGIVASWRHMTSVYPRKLKLNLLRQYVPRLVDCAQELEASAERCLGALTFHFFLYHGVQALSNVLFALNEVYDPADRREEKTVLPHLRRVPREFMPRLTYLLHGPFDEQGAIKRAQSFKKIADEVVAMSEAELSAPS